jgi:hypothetical protein
MWSKQALDGCKLRADCSCQCYCELLCQKPVSEHYKGHYGKHQAAAAQLLLGYLCVDVHQGFETYVE